MTYFIYISLLFIGAGATIAASEPSSRIRRSIAGEGRESHFDVTVGSGTVIDFSAAIIAENGPITIGGGCVIKAQVKIINRLPYGQVLTIGNGNVFEEACTIEARDIGGGNIFQSNCYIGNKVTIGNGCIIGAGCRLTGEQTIHDGTVVNGNSCNNFY